MRMERERERKDRKILKNLSGGRKIRNKSKKVAIFLNSLRKLKT